MLFLVNEFVDFLNRLLFNIWLLLDQHGFGGRSGISCTDRTLLHSHCMHDKEMHSELVDLALMVMYYLFFLFSSSLILWLTIVVFQVYSSWQALALELLGKLCIVWCWNHLHMQVGVDIPYLEFGTSVIGETLKKCVTLTNCGALPTTFHFFRKSGDTYFWLFQFCLCLGVCVLSVLSIIMAAL